MSEETILVVEDNQEFANSLIKYMLTPLNYRAIHAKNGYKGLNMAKIQQPDLILLDMSMPGMTGLQMLSALRKTDCEAPVIFMTAEGSESVAVEAFRLGVRDYLAKPFSREELVAVVDGALQESRLAQEKEKLTKDLIVSETIRQTVVTLSHYLNNYLVVLNGNLFLLQEELPASTLNVSELLDILQECQQSTEKIETVLKILRRVTAARHTAYHGEIKMIDIEAALRKELGEA